jgi:hypothetical protein
MTLRVDPSKLPLAPVVNPIKAKMISDIMDSESLGLPKLYETIQNFTVPGQSTWGKMFTHKDRSENDLPARVEEMKSGSFDERALVAQVIIRKHDIAFDVHCDKAGCGSSCVFAPQGKVIFTRRLIVS